MTAHKPFPAATDRLLVADASKVSPADFMRASMSAFCPAPPPSRIRERADAATDYIAAMFKADPKDEALHHRIRTEFADRLREIETRYAGQFRETHRVVVRGRG